MTTDNDPIARLATLCEGGDLRFVYVVGVARSNSTVVCKVLGDRLDGAVYEPATPVAVHLHNHYARTILKAYDAARAGKPEREPVLLAIKDLSLFIDDEIFALVLRYAAHIVFTVRDPLTQYPSLVKQFKTEFSLRNRIDALVRWPVETCLLGYYMLTLGTGYFVNASRAFGFSLAEVAAAADCGVEPHELAERRRAVRQGAGKARRGAGDRSGCRVDAAPAGRSDRRARCDCP